MAKERLSSEELVELIADLDDNIWNCRASQIHFAHPGPDHDGVASEYHRGAREAFEKIRSLLIKKLCDTRA